VLLCAKSACIIHHTQVMVDMLPECLSSGEGDSLIAVDLSTSEHP
jgi:hypothetical protein